MFLSLYIDVLKLRSTPLPYLKIIFMLMKFYIYKNLHSKCIVLTCFKSYFSVFDNLCLKDISTVHLFKITDQQ